MITQGTGVKISDCANIIKDDILQLVHDLKGEAVIAKHANEEVLTGFNNVVGPKVLILFVGEESYGSEDTKDVTARVNRYYDVVVVRGKVLGDPRNIDLTTNTLQAMAFLDQVEMIRDAVRAVIWPAPLAYNPTQYIGIRGLGDDSGLLLNKYIISVSVICEIPRIIVTPDPITNGNEQYVQLSDNQPFANNQFAR